MLRRPTSQGIKNIQKEIEAMPYLLVGHKVADFSKRKPAYDAHFGARQKAGLKEEHLLRNSESPNEVVLLLKQKTSKRQRSLPAHRIFTRKP
jgi:hypothetical protein